MFNDDLSTRTLTLDDLEQVSLLDCTLIDNEICFQSDPVDMHNCIKGGSSFGIFDRDNRLVAFSLAICNEYCIGYVDKCYVSPPYRGKGYQCILIKENIRSMTQKGACEIFAMCSPKNVVSHKNFIKAGFVVFREIKCQGLDRLLLKYAV